MRVIVCGGRNYGQRVGERATLRNYLSVFHASTPITLLIHGAARGADTLAGEWAEDNGVPVKACPADWNVHGRSAGFIRNREMLNERPDGVVAFPGGSGTEDMVEVALHAGVVIYKPIPKAVERAHLDMFGS